MRAGIVAIIFFAAVLALGHYVAAPMFCRGGLAIPSLDPRALCGADFHLNRQGSVLLYFAAIAIAMFFGLIVAMFSRPRPEQAKEKDAAKEEKKDEKKKEEKPGEPFEQLVVATEKAEAEKKEPAPVPVAHPSAAAAPSPAPAPMTEAAVSPATEPTAVAEPTPTPIVQVPQASASQSAEAAITAALFPSEVKPEAASQPAPPAEAKPEIISSAEAISAAEAITAGLAAKKSGANKPFDGTNEELLERFRELKKLEGVNSIAQAQKLLDESTLAALSKGIDPKQHLSQVAHLVLAEDPDLKSGVVRGVVVHVAARLKELGVVNQKFIPPAKSA